MEAPDGNSKNLEKRVGMRGGGGEGKEEIKERINK